MKRKLIAAIFLLLLLLLIMASPSAALTDAEENQLRDDFEAFETDVVNYLESEDQEIWDYFGTQNTELQAYVDSATENFLNEAMAKLAVWENDTSDYFNWLQSTFAEFKENLKRETDDKYGNLKSDFENNILSARQDLQSEVDNLRDTVRKLGRITTELRNSNIEEAALGFGIAGVVIALLVLGGLKTGGFAKGYPESSNDPKKIILNLLALKDFRHETSAPRYILAGIDSQLKTLSEDYPKDFEEAMVEIKKTRNGESPWVVKRVIRKVRKVVGGQGEPVKPPEGEEVETGRE